MSGSTSVFQFGPFEFDQGASRLCRDGTPVDLPPRLVDLLVFLATHPGDLLTKDELIAAVWPGVFVSDNSLARAVSDLRRYLGDTAEEPTYIQTVSRRGYRFVAAVHAGTRRASGVEVDPRALAAFKMAVDAGRLLESLSADALPAAVALFERQKAVKPDDARVRMGLAHAYFFQYEANRAGPMRDGSSLEKGVLEAREACRLDPALGDAWAALGVILAAQGHVADGRAALRQAIALEPDNWRHHFRHAYISWGEERLRSVARTLALQPAQPFAHLIAAVVFIARGAFDAARNTLANGVNAQDLQRGRPAMLPAAGLHWTLGLVLAALGRRDDALAECTRELEFGREQTVYTAEFMTNACVLRGSLLLSDRPSEAIVAFQDALRWLPGQGRAHLGLALAHQALGRTEEASREFERMDQVIEHLMEAGRPSEALLIRAAHLVVLGRTGDAAAALERALTEAPFGSFGWIIPVEPFLAPAVNAPAFARIRAILAERAA